MLPMAARLEKLLSIKKKNIKLNYYYEGDLLNGDSDRCCRCQMVFDLLTLSNMCTSLFLGSYLKANMEMFFTQVYI